MLYSLRKYKSLWVLRRKKLIVFALQILMWMLKISPGIFSPRVSAMCLLGEPLLGREGGGCRWLSRLTCCPWAASHRWGGTQSLLSKDVCMQVTSAGGQLDLKEIWNWQGKHGQAPSIVLCPGKHFCLKLSLAPRRAPPLIPREKRKMSHRERRWNLFPGWVSKETQCFLFHFRKTIWSLDE